MECDVRLSEYVYRNAQICCVNIQRVLEIAAGNEKFVKALNAQQAEYREICNEAENLLSGYCKSPKRLCRWEKMRFRLMIDMETLCDKSVSHLAAMMVIGSNMGVVNAIKNIKRYGCVGSDAMQLAKKLQKTEENNVQLMKQYI